MQGYFLSPNKIQLNLYYGWNASKYSWASCLIGSYHSPIPETTSPSFPPPHHPVLSTDLCHSWKLGEHVMYKPPWMWPYHPLLCLECLFISRAFSGRFSHSTLIMPLWGRLRCHPIVQMRNWDSAWVWQVRWLALGPWGSGRAGVRTQGSNNPGRPSPPHLGTAFCFYYLAHQYVAL